MTIAATLPEIVANRTPLAEKTRPSKAGGARTAQRQLIATVVVTVTRGKRARACESETRYVTRPDGPRVITKWRNRGLVGVKSGYHSDMLRTLHL